MNFEEMKAKFQELLGMTAPEKQGEASEILTALTDEVNTMYSTKAENESKISELTANNETLRAVNAKLFLKVGEVPKAGTDNTPHANEGTQPEKTFESLFNDKGELI